MSYFYVIVFILIMVVLVITLSKVKQKNNEETNSSGYKYKQKELMTDNEFEFFNRLIQALPEYYVFPQVSMGAVLDAMKDEKRSQAGRNTFNKKIIDYVIYGKDKKIVAIIELDDKTHTQEKDDKRDTMLLEARYKVFRFDSRKKPTIEEIKKTIVL